MSKRDEYLYERLNELGEKVKNLEDRAYLDRMVLDEREKKIGELALENSNLKFELHNPQAQHFPLCNVNLYGKGDGEYCNLDCVWNMDKVRKAWGQANSGGVVTEGIPQPRYLNISFRTVIAAQATVKMVQEDLEELFDMTALKIEEDKQNG